MMSYDLSNGIFHFYSNFNRTFCKQIVDSGYADHIMRVSDLGLHGLHMSNKRTLGLYGLSLNKSFQPV